MLGINHTKSAKDTKDYYPRDDYYGKGGSVIGNWIGQASGKLGLSGKVLKKHFALLCDNLHPFQKTQVTARTKDDRRPGYDFTFSLWKSASVLVTLYGDRRILDVFAAAVLSTMEAMEPFMEARVRADGADYNRRTGNMVVAPFLHHVTRPENGMPDPHLHVHAVALNMTWDGIENKWKAGQFGRIKGMGHYFEEMFDAKVADGIRKLGYQVERRGKTADYEIRDVPDEVVRKFSQRTTVIEAKAAELKITDPRVKAKLNKITRNAKMEGLGEAELVEHWKGRLSQEEHLALEKVVHDAAARGQAAPEAHPTAVEMVDYAARHLFERCSVLEEHQLLAAAMEYGAGAVTIDELKVELKTSGFIREEHEGTVFLTTQGVLEEEAECVAFARETRGTLAPIRMVHDEPDPKLSSEQWSAFKHVLESRDGVTALSGSPGSGKTTVMTPIIKSIEKEGLKVFTFAPSAEASRKVLRDEGFSNADTLTRFLIDTKLQEEARGQVVWIDEAGLIGAADMHRLFELSWEKKFRLVLSGDIGQHGPVARGDALRLLIKHAGLKCAQVRTVRRQKIETYREAVQAIADGDLERGFATLDQAGSIHEITGDGDRFGALARAYLRVLGAKNDCLVVSPSHAESRKVTALIRDKLKGAGKLAVAETPILQLENLRWTDAQRSNAALYQPGLVVQFHQNTKGKIFRGDRFTVTRVDGGMVEMRHASGKVRTLALDAAPSFNVFEEKRLPVSVGELVRLSAGGTSGNQPPRKLENGSLQRIKEISKTGDLVCESGVILGADFGHLTYGYCGTSISSQGKTVDHVIVAQSAESLGRASSLEQFNVSVSRGRKSVQVFTDNKPVLLRAVSRSSARMSAHDLVPETRRGRVLRHAKLKSVQHRRQSMGDSLSEHATPVPGVPVDVQDVTKQPTEETGPEI